MNTHGHNLSLNDQGPQVEIPHTEPRYPGLPVPNDEAAVNRLGPGTHRVVAGFHVSAMLETHSPHPAGGDAPQPSPPPIPAAVPGAVPGTPGVPPTTWPPRAALAPAAESLAPTAAPTPTVRQYRVRGRVRHADGSPLAGSIVRAFDKDMRSEQALGETTTDAEGQYEIGYTGEQFARAEKKSADLIVRVLSAAGLPLAESSVLFNAPVVATVDLTVEGAVARGPSEYERYGAELRPVSQGVPSADLTEQDIRFLAGETGIDALHIAYLAVAAKHEKQTQVSAAVFYGLFRQNIPSRLSALLAQSPQALRRALEASLRDDIVPARFEPQLDAILERLDQLVEKHVFDSDDPNGRIPFADVVATSLQPRGKQVAFLKAYARHEGPIEEFWKSLREQPEFSGPGAVEDLQFTLQLNLLTRSSVPVMQALRGLRQNGTLRSARDLTRLDAAAWTQLVNGASAGDREVLPADTPGGTKEEKVASYVNRIVDTLEAAFPTPYVATAVARQPEIDVRLVKQVLEKNPGVNLNEPLPEDADLSGVAEAERDRAKAAMAALRREVNTFREIDTQRLLAEPGGTTGGGFHNPIRAEVARFFANLPDFDLPNTHIDNFLTEHGEQAFAGIGNRDAVTRHLKRVQRVLNAAPKVEHMEFLLGEGFDSAAAIARASPQAFVRHFSAALGGEAKAREYQARARHIASTMLTVFTSVYQRLNDAMPRVIADA